MTLRQSLTPDERPRERLIRLGPGALTDAELVALMIGSGLPGRHAIGVAHDLLAASNGLRGLHQQTVGQLQRIKGLGPARACQLAACFELAARTSLSEIRRGSVMRDIKRVKSYCRTLLSSEPIEHCVALLLDSQQQIIECCEISRGTLNEAPVYPREVVKLALTHHAKSLILTHNHPSGNAQPSAEDIVLTNALAQALALIDVVLLDHIIVAGPNVVSLVEQGWAGPCPD